MSKKNKILMLKLAKFVNETLYVCEETRLKVCTSTDQIFGHAIKLYLCLLNDIVNFDFHLCDFF